MKKHVLIIQSAPPKQENTLRQIALRSDVAMKHLRTGMSDLRTKSSHQCKLSKTLKLPPSTHTKHYPMQCPKSSGHRIAKTGSITLQQEQEVIDAAIQVSLVEGGGVGAAAATLASRPSSAAKRVKLAGLNGFKGACHSGKLLSKVFCEGGGIEDGENGGWDFAY